MPDEEVTEPSEPLVNGEEGQNEPEVEEEQNENLVPEENNSNCPTNDSSLMNREVGACCDTND